MFYAVRRDDNEPEIVKALRLVGATVQPLSITGAPDLLVGFEGRTYLIEVKAEHGKSGKGHKKTERGLRESQEKWWDAWQGSMPVIVVTPREALIAIGAVGKSLDAEGNAP